MLGTVAGLSSTRAAAGLSRNLRGGMFSRIQDFSFANIDKFSTNSLVTRMTTDVMNVQNAVMMILRVAAKASHAKIVFVFPATSPQFIAPIFSFFSIGIISWKVLFWRRTP